VATTLMLFGIGMIGAIALGIVSGLLNLVAFLRTDPFASSSACGSHPAIQHTGTLYHHHSDDPLAARRVRKFSYSEIYCHSREYRAGGGNDWDSLLGLVVGA
jgi:hypothetical protein